MNLIHRDGKCQKKQIHIRDRATKEADGLKNQAVPGISDSRTGDEEMEDILQLASTSLTSRRGHKPHTMFSYLHREKVAQVRETNVLQGFWEATQRQPPQHANPREARQTILHLRRGGGEWR